MSSMPWFKFYPDAFLSDNNLRRCTHAQRGVWIAMLCLMHQSERRGYLMTGDHPWTDEEVAAAVGGPTEETLVSIRELVAKGVASRDETGAILSRRMVRDEAKRTLCSEAGRKGGGNPNLTTFKPFPKVGPKVVPKVGPNPPLNLESRGESLEARDENLETREQKKGNAAARLLGSSNGTAKASKPEVTIPPELDTPEFRAAWTKWETHRREIGHRLKPTTASSQLQSLAAWGVARAIAAIDHTVFKGWQGLREPSDEGMRHAGSNGTTSGLLREDFDGCLPGETTAQALIRKGKL